MNLTIKDVKVHVVRREPKEMGTGLPAQGQDGRRYLGVLRIISEEGLEGHAFIGEPETRSDRAIAPLAETVRPFLLGKDALDREWLWHELRRVAPRWDVPDATIMAVDVALWDLAGKAAGLPLYQLLGAYSHKIPAYVSAALFKVEIEANVEDALACKERGFTTYKFHYGVPDLPRVVEVCTRVRQAVGDRMDLIFDPGGPGPYTFQEALYVGRALDELNYHWFEDPIRPQELDSLAELTRRLDTPIALSDAKEFRLAEAPNAIDRKAARILIAEPAKDGVTGMKKLASLCEAHGLRVQFHYGGNSLLNVANLQVALGVRNTHCFPLFWPTQHSDFGLVQDLDIDPEGYIHAPQGPGLGVEIDWGVIDRLTEAIL